MVGKQASGPPVSRLRIRNITLLIGSAMTVMSTAIISPALPAIESAFGEQPDAALLTRLTLTVPGLAIAVTAPLAGTLIDRWGRRPVLLSSLLLYGVAGSAGFFANSFGVLLLTRALLGVGVAGVMSSFTTLIGDYFSGPDLNRFMGWQAAGNSFGSGLAVLLGGILADLGWRYPFLIYSVAFLLFPLVLFYVNEPEIKQEGIGSAGRVAFPWRKVLPIYLLVFAGMAIFYLIPVQLPFYLASAGISGALIGIAIAALTLTAGIGSLNYQRLKAQLDFGPIFALTFGLMGAGYLVVGASTNYLVVIAGLLIAGSGLAFFIPNSNVRLVSMVSARVRGRAVGGLTTSLHLGQFFSPLLAQPFVARLGLGATYQIAALVLFFMAAPFLVGALRRRRNKAR